MASRVASGAAAPGEVFTMAVLDLDGPAADGTWTLPAEVGRVLRDFTLYALIMAVDVLRAADAAALDTDGETKH